MSHTEEINRKYMISEREEREKLVAKYVDDETYEWKAEDEK